MKNMINLQLSQGAFRAFATHALGSELQDLVPLDMVTLDKGPVGALALWCLPKNATGTLIPKV